MSKAISRRNFLMATGAVGAAGLLAACGSKPAASSTASSAASQAPAASADESLALSDGPVSLSISWWGGDSRHAAYQSALEAFQAEHSNITVEPTFAAWSGWEEKMAAAFIAGNAQDVCQVNWNWLYNYSADGSKFVDLNTTSKFIDLTQWDSAAMDACYVANSQQCVPVSMTGRIFYWNMTTFNKAGITEVPKSLDDLMAAGKAFQEKLGDDYYPMHLGAYDRMILMVFYLESKYGKDWADPVTSTLNYTEDEIAEGLADGSGQALQAWRVHQSGQHPSFRQSEVLYLAQASCGLWWWWNHARLFRSAGYNQVYQDAPPAGCQEYRHQPQSEVHRCAS